MNAFNEKISSAVQNWWVSLLLGLLYILIAICLMFTPLASYIALSMLFSIAMFVSGTLEILFAVSNRKHISSWGWYLAGGIIDLILGMLSDGQSGSEYDCSAFHSGLLVNVQRLLFNGLCDGSETVRHRKLGLVYGFRYPGDHL